MRLPDCFSGYGHDWIEVCTIGEHADGIHKHLCSRCDTVITIDERERLRRGQRSGLEVKV